MTSGSGAGPRALWHLLEPVHAVLYFTGESRSALAGAGLRGFWMGYFGARACPLGAVGAPVVTATFYNFAPRMVARAVPDAWAFAPPDRVLEARLAGVDRALARLLGPPDDGGLGAAVARAAELSAAAVSAGEPAGRPLFAANAALAPPDQPHLRLWWAATCLREHRGDGHLAALVRAGLDGCEAHVLHAGSGAVDRPLLQDNRGWTDDEWSEAADRLRRRGLVDDDGALTPEGHRLRGDVEATTDELAAGPFRALGDDRCHELAAALAPVAGRITAAGTVPYPNPIGLPRPGDGDG